MTTVYFVRHAQSDASIRDGRIRPLTDKGLKDAKSLALLFKNIEIDQIVSSPYKRAIDTVLPLADQHKLKIITIDDFKERRSDSIQTIEMTKLIEMQWNDYTYTLSDGECLKDVQNRNISALRRVLAENNEKTIIIGTHGMALCTIMHFYRPLNVIDLRRILLTMPYIIRMDFDDDKFIDMKECNTDI